MLRSIRAPTTATSHNVIRTINSAPSATQITKTRARQCNPAPHHHRHPQPIQHRHTSNHNHNQTPQTLNPSPSTHLPSHSPTTHHTNLQTFLHHATRTSLSPTTPTYLGTLYEYLTQTHLQTHLNFTLTRVGGRGDSGIDLLGIWALPQVLRANTNTTSIPNADRDDAIRVLIQCKRVNRGSPSLIRELEGSFAAAPSGYRNENVLGVMVCTAAATKGVRDAMSRSTRGLVWVMLEECEDDVGDVSSTTAASADDGRGGEAGEQTHYRIPTTKIRQFLYNAVAASKCGLEGVGVGMIYDGTGGKKEVQLLWTGIPIDFKKHESREDSDRDGGL